MSPEQTREAGTARYVRHVVIALLLLALALLLRTLASVLLLVFGAILVAVILRAAADPLRRWTRLPGTACVLAVVLLLLLLFAGGGWLFGERISVEASQFLAELPRAWSSVQQRLSESQLGQRALKALDEVSLPQGSDVVSRLASFGSAVANAAANLLIVLFAGLYLALAPARYRDGVAMLFPRHRAEQVRSAFDNSGRALRLWLLGQLVSMLTIGVLTGVGLALAGVPSAAALGVVAGIAEFVPLLGPLVAAVPGVILAASAGGDTVLWALAVYVAVQQVESNLVTPLVEKRAVSLPPVLTLFGVLALGVLFGPLGVVLATPLVVVAFVIIKQVYVRDTLGYRTEVPGEEQGRRP